MPIFSDLSDSAIQRILDLSTEFEVGPGKMVFVEKGESRGLKATSERLVAFAVHMG